MVNSKMNERLGIGFQKSVGNPNFGFDFSATVRFGSGF